MAPNYDIVQRTQALTLLQAGRTTKEASVLSGIPVRSISRIQQKAYERGYDPRISTILRLKYIEDGARSGRPKTASSEEIEQAIVQNGL